MDSVYSIKQFVAYISLSFGRFEAAAPPIKTYTNYSKPLKYSVFYCIIRDRGVPYRNTYNMLKINGFEAAAPCKGKGISAQGKVNGVNDTLGPPMNRV